MYVLFKNCILQKCKAWENKNKPRNPLCSQNAGKDKRIENYVRGHRNQPRRFNVQSWA